MLSALTATAHWQCGVFNVTQVDTGPVSFPDLTKRYDRPFKCLSVVFNAPHFADFVIERPTPVVEEGVETCRVDHDSQPCVACLSHTLHVTVERCRVYHDSQPFSLPAGNRVQSVALPEEVADCSGSESEVARRDDCGAHHSVDSGWLVPRKQPMIFQIDMDASPPQSRSGTRRNS